MRVRKITINDACAVTEYTRDQLRGMFRDLPPFLECGSAPGARRTFTRSELLVICVIASMETQFGTRRAAIGSILDQLLSVLKRPRPIDPLARLNVVFEPAKVTYLAANSEASEGVVVPLGPIFARVDHYLGGQPDVGDQGELPLSPVILRNSASKT
jgi:hypothetical protein